MPSIASKAGAGVLQVIIILLFCALAAFFLYEGTGLVYSGVQGNWQVSMELQGMKLYVTSIIPGLLVVFGGVAIMLWGLPNALKKMK